MTEVVSALGDVVGKICKYPKSNDKASIDECSVLRRRETKWMLVLWVLVVLTASYSLLVFWALHSNIHGHC